MKKIKLLIATDQVNEVILNILFNIYYSHFIINININS